MEATTFEICCGSAGLSDALRCLGFQVYPIDHAAIRQGQSFHPRCFEFRSGAALGTNVAPLQTVSHSHGLTVWKMLKSKREPTLAKFGGRMDPPQLRDASHLMGLPNLRAADQAKVDSANKLYRCAIHLLRVCMTIGCLLSTENPTRSGYGPYLQCWSRRHGIHASFHGLQIWKAFILMHVRKEAQGIKIPNCFRHLVCLLHWKQVARKSRAFFVATFSN